MNNESNAKESARSPAMVRLYPQASSQRYSILQTLQACVTSLAGAYSLRCGATMLDGDHLATSGDALAAMQLER